MEIDQPQPEIKTSKKKCHGNRKLYHFKRKCRSRGMTEEQITALINTRNNEQHQANDAGSTVVLPNRHQLEQKKQKQINVRRNVNELKERMKNESDEQIHESTLCFPTITTKEIKDEWRRRYYSVDHP